MAVVAQQESTRLAEQERLDGLKQSAERNEWGQFATPPALAKDIAEYASNLWQKTNGSTVRFLEPAIGTGAFYSALLQTRTARQIEAATGIELDPLFAKTARTIWGATGLQVIESDFTTLDPTGQFTLVLTNPPYVRHHHLSAGAKELLRARIGASLGLRISGLAGLYCYFMLLADQWLRDGALSVWLVPSEFMTVNYGRAVKDYLMRRVSLLHIHRFCPSDVQFADALVSSAVVVFQKSPSAKNHRVRFSFGGRLNEPRFERFVGRRELERERRWTRFTEPVAITSAEANDDLVTLGDLFSVKRGIATGDNRFFVLPRSEAVRLEIPLQFCKPILPSPRRLPEPIIEAEPDGYPITDPQWCVIDCTLPPEIVEKDFPQLWRYLQTGVQKAVDRRYLTSRRVPWYCQEKRQPAPFLCTYMGRTSHKSRNPFRFFWNKSAAIAPNVFLMLYPRGPMKRLLHAHPELHNTVFESLSRTAVDHCISESRVYGGALYKLEPSELARVPLQSLASVLGLGPAAPQGLLFE